MPFVYYICFHIIANTFILLEIFRQETKMSIAPKHDYWCESRTWKWQLLNPRPQEGGGGYSWEFLIGVCCPVLQILTQFQTQKCNFLHPFSDQTSKIHTRLLRLECKQKNSSNPFRIRIFLFLSHSFGFETIHTLIHSVVPSKTIPDSRPKWGKSIPVFRPKRHKNPTRWGGTYLHNYIHTCLECYTDK